MRSNKSVVRSTFVSGAKVWGRDMLERTNMRIPRWRLRVSPRDRNEKTRKIAGAVFIKDRMRGELDWAHSVTRQGTETKESRRRGDGGYG